MPNTKRISCYLPILVLSFLIFPSFVSASLHIRTTDSHSRGRQNFTARKFDSYARNLYKKIGLSGLTGLKTFKTCLIGYLNLKRQGLLKKDGLLVLIDYTRPSDKDRFFVLDIKKERLLYKSLVAHGRNSGKRFACGFSNRPGSYKSCLGFFITGRAYEGKHGYSLFINGLEQGFNDNAAKRHIVIHGADYVSRQFVKQYGRTGRSLGCPALPQKIAPRIIRTIKDGSCLFIFGKDRRYFKNSPIINAKGAIQYFEKAGI